MTDKDRLACCLYDAMCKGRSWAKGWGAESAEMHEVFYDWAKILLAQGLRFPELVSADVA